MAPRERQRNNKPCSALAPPTLPADLLLEIVARSNVTTLVRCAAACRLLRSRILTNAFIQQQVVTGVVPRRVLARIHAGGPKRRRKPVVSLVYPATPAASSLVDKHLAPFVSRWAADLLRDYEVVTSRHGLIVFHRHHHLKRRETSGSNLCVYDPMTGVRTFLSEPPCISMDNGTSCVLLTAADGIGCRCSFLLLVAKMTDHRTYSTIRVQTSAPSDSGDISWGQINTSVCRSGPFDAYKGLVVLSGGVIHWLTYDEQILRYNVRTGMLGTVKHPQVPGHHHLAMSSDGRRLRILAVQGFMISVWEQLSAEADGWSLGATIDTKEKLRSMHPNIIIHGPVSLQLRCSEEIRSNAVLLEIHGRGVVLDLETMEMRKQEDSTSYFRFEVDLPARLQAMRIF